MLRKFYRLLAASIAGFLVLSVPLIFIGTGLAHSNPRLFVALVIGLVTAYTLAAVEINIWLLREQRRLARDNAAPAGQQPIPAATKPAWEYRSKVSLLGLPLLHLRIGGNLRLRQKPVRAWLAFGDVAFGGLFAFGGVAIAPLCTGGLAIGLVPFGGCALGLLALGGFSLGWWSFGGCAIGWLSFGGCALAWKAALGPLAVAHDFALGTTFVLPISTMPWPKPSPTPPPFFRYGQILLRHLYWVNLLWIIPMIFWWRIQKRRSAQPNQ